jgi:hypothetical protein
MTAAAIAQSVTLTNAQIDQSIAGSKEKGTHPKFGACSYEINFKADKTYSGQVTCPGRNPVLFAGTWWAEENKLCQQDSSGKGCYKVVEVIRGKQWRLDNKRGHAWIEK